MIELTGIREKKTVRKNRELEKMRESLFSKRCLDVAQGQK